MRYALERFKMARFLTNSLMDQLSQCKSDEARRLILGIGEQYDAPVAVLSKKIVNPKRHVDWRKRSAA